MQSHFLCLPINIHYPRVMKTKSRTSQSFDQTALLLPLWKPSLSVLSIPGSLLPSDIPWINYETHKARQREVQPDDAMCGRLPRSPNDRPIPQRRKYGCFGGKSGKQRFPGSRAPSIPHPEVLASRLADAGKMSPFLGVCKMCPCPPRDKLRSRPRAGLVWERKVACFTSKTEKNVFRVVTPAQRLPSSAHKDT